MSTVFAREVRIVGLLLVLLLVDRCIAQDSAPRLLGAPTPSGKAIVGAEILVLQAVSDDGQRFLITSTSDRLTTNDHNASIDTFLFERGPNQFTLLSTTAGSQSGNGASLAGAMSADAGRVVFESRASNLVAFDTNSAWDIIARDSAGTVNLLVSVATNGAAGRGASVSPRISADGRQVLFKSLALDLAPRPAGMVDALYLRDVQAGTTKLVSTNLSGLGTNPPAMGDAFMTDDARFVAFTAIGRTNGLFRRDVPGARTVWLSATSPAGFPVRGALGYANPVSSADGAWVACRVMYGKTNGFFRYEVSALTVRAFGVTTNSPPSGLDGSQLGPAMSAAGRFVAYAQATTVAGASSAVLQVFRWDATSQVATLVSAEPGSGNFGNSHALAPLISLDGRYVAFLSDATNLVEGFSEPVLRAYRWDGDTGTTRVLAELGGGIKETSFVISRNGAWIGALASGLDGTFSLHVFDAAAGQATRISLAPALEESSTTRGGLAIQPSGVSQDGRYVALLAFPPNPAGGVEQGQVLLLDTRAGTRFHVSLGLDVQPASFNCTTPSISADGAVLAYASDATNLTTADSNGFRDAFVSRIADVPHRLIRPPNLSTARHAGPEVVVSPDGRYLLFSLEESSKFIPRLADLQSGAISPALPGVSFGAPVFSQDGVRLAVAVTTLPSTTLPAVKVFDVPAWIAGGGASAILWSAPLKTYDPVFSQDGSRLAYWLSATGQNEVRVVDWAQNQPRLALNLGNASPSSLSLSADGRALAWVATGPAGSSVPQAWRADLSDQAVTLVSVALGQQTGGNGATRHVALSANGRYAAFASLADDLVENDANGAGDVFLRDLQTARTILVSRTLPGAAGNGGSTRPFFSPDGTCLFFLSHAQDLAVGDLNQGVDLFKVDVVGEAGGLLVVLERNLATGAAQLLWNGRPGTSYRVEFKDALGPGPWQSLPGTFHESAPIELGLGEVPRRFYRIVEVP